MWISGDRIQPKDQSIQIELVIVGTNPMNYFCKGNHTPDRIVLEKKQAHIDYEEVKPRRAPGDFSNASEEARRSSVKKRQGLDASRKMDLPIGSSGMMRRRPAAQLDDEDE